MIGKVPTLVGLCLAALCAVLVVMDSRNHSGKLADHWQLEEDTPTMRRLNRVNNAVMGRIGQKTYLIGQVIEGQMSLLAAAAWFRHYHDSSAEESRPRLDGIEGDTQDEKFVNQVLIWARQSMSSLGTSQKNEVLQRLECELAAARQLGNGKVILPGS